MMVTKFGMNDALGAVSYGRSRGARYLDVMGEDRNFSEETSQRIDGEIHKIIEAQDVRALEILTRRRAVLNAIVARLARRRDPQRRRPAGAGWGPEI